ncbi:MAG: thermonuclease family protein [Aphanothece saxicola GSE-SYN-MK-01-06B]|nr:thermonuclease family protein [Aphanothece saxicola GSE-SYN-MK-01-06B]
MIDAARRRGIAGLTVLALAMSAAPVQAIPPPQPDDVRIVRVVDGHTIVVTPYGEPFTVWLACIHSPPLRQGPEGPAARAALERLLPTGAWVTLSTRGKTADGVELAEILPVDSTVSVNLRLVQDGLAWMDRQTLSPCDRAAYGEAEMKAKSKKLGIWGSGFGPGMGPAKPMN